MSRSPDRRRLLAGGLAALCAGRAAAAGFDPAGIPRAELRVLQAALARAGTYPGLLDGAWGPQSQRALDAWGRQHGVSGTAALGPLLTGFDKQLTSEDWRVTAIRHGSLSLMLPMALVTRQPGLAGETVFASKGETLAIRIAEGTPDDAEGLVQWIRSRDRAGTPVDRDTSEGRITEADTRTGQVHLRTLRFDARRVSVLIESVAAMTGPARLAAASLGYGKGQPLVLPKGAALRRRADL